MTIDVLYLAKDRREFTEFTFGHLIANTDWSLVRDLIVYDDGSTDGTRVWLEAQAVNLVADGQPGPNIEIRFTEFGSPVGVMNDYVSGTDSERFAKVDNDIVVPPGWLNALVECMDRNPDVEVLGMEAGRMGIPAADFDGIHATEHARWIGGIGLLRTSTLGERPEMTASGRFGWTEWQREYRPNIAWIVPDLAVADLSRIPFEPWVGYSDRYRRGGEELERPWPRYHERWCQWYWAWWAPEHAQEALA